MKQSLLARLTNQPDALTHLLAGLREDQIRQRPQPKKWSIFQNLAHLARYQDVFMERIQRIIAEETPSFSRYIANDDAGFSNWTPLSLQELSQRMILIRTVLTDFLSSLEEDQLKRVGLHPAYGPMTIEGWTEFFLLHEAHHFFTILKLGSTLRASKQPMGF
ncbi:DUF664 domain-containing protein [Spirosoma sp. HMF3257]|uniref:DinB-like domain-containing protein n=1 Tax=Spirosoma telluris TaxID=2183553 RepID=A0A327NT27_9BACT|nr:DUF664 domain-containing protein [Spirosoma telluris]RAI77733.1 hypothetical protein HMF3257_32840 [Spirosoma telluris]